MTRRFALWASTVAGLALASAVGAAPMQTVATGANAAAIQAAVDAFRAALGDPNNGNAPGPLASGRREINWDGGGATTPSLAGTPFTGFENIRGATMTTPGSGFIQAAPADLATQFANATYATTFDDFSPLRLFTPIESNVTDVTFSVPGTNGAVPATVSAFGAVFSDVDLPTSTSMEFFDAVGNPLVGVGVPATLGEATFSFLGVLFDAGERIGRVRITTGNVPLGPNDSIEQDVAVMDDFLYSEPIPEPGTLALVSLGIAGLTFAGRHRRG